MKKNGERARTKRKGGHRGKLPEWKWEKLLEMVLKGFSLEDCAEILRVSPEVIEGDFENTFGMSFAEHSKEVEENVKRRELATIRDAARQGDARARAWLKERNLLKDGE